MHLVKPGFAFLPHLEYSSMLYNVCIAVADCYGITIPASQKEREDFIRRRLKDKHASIIEHVGFSVRLSVDRGITHELVRHRLMSVTQESTRYCKYDLPKFGSEITFIMPPFLSEQIEEGHYMVHAKFDDESFTNINHYILISINQQTGATKEQIIKDKACCSWLLLQQMAEQSYLEAVQTSQGQAALMQPQIARGMLTNALRAHITITANMREWRHIFMLRALGTTGPPHPQMTEIMLPLLEEATRRFPVFFEDL